MHAKTLFALAAACGLAVAAGCQRGQQQQTPPPPEPAAGAPPPQAGQAPAGEEMAGQPGIGMGMREMCPMMVDDTNVQVTDLEDGVALTFTTEGNVEDLRQRVENMAATYEQRGERGQMAWRQMRGRDQQRGMGHRGMGQMPQVQADVEEIEGGSRVVLRPEDPQELQALRTHARMHQQRMQGGACWMLEERQRAT